MNYSYNNYQTPYNNVYTGYQQPVQAPQPVQQPMQKYLPLTFVNGIEGAKAFIVNPNQTYYLIDDDSNTLYVKSSDNLGKPSLRAYSIRPLDTFDKPIQQYNNENLITKKELNDLQLLLETKINKLSEKFEKSITNEISAEKEED